MLTLRPEQMRAFSEAALKRFEETMLAHLKKFFPDKYEAAGEPKVRKLIRYGIERAASYDITAQRDVSRYIDLMMTLGPDFDQDKQLPWAGQILRTRNKPEVRISILLKTAEKHLKES
jgi:hypothetical protein